MTVINAEHLYCCFDYNEVTKQTSNYVSDIAMVHLML